MLGIRDGVRILVTRSIIDNDNKKLNLVILEVGWTTSKAQSWNTDR